MPTHISYEDDSGHEFLGFAKSQLAKLISTASRSSGYANQTFFIPDADGVRVDLRVCKDQSYINISGSVGVDLINGMTDPSYIKTITVKVNGEDQNVDVMQKLFPSALQAQLDGKGRAWRDEENLAVELQDSDFNFRIDSTRTRFAQTAHVAPCMFTGSMRYAVQLAMGLKLNKIEYQHTFNCTHGIYMAGKKPWLIEISQANGIIAMKLSGYKKAKGVKLDKSIKDKFPMIPDGKAFPKNINDAIAKGKVIRLLAASEMADYFVCNPYYTDCCWAFNDSGTMAVNTAWDWPETYKMGHLFRISIAGDANGPTSASFTKSESNFLWNSAHVGDLNNSRFYVPTGHNTEIMTFDMTMQTGGFQIAPSAQPWKTPIYAFFVGNSEKIYYHEVIMVGKNIEGGWTPFDPGTTSRLHNIQSQIGEGTPNDPAVLSGQFHYVAPASRFGFIDFSGPEIEEPIMDPTEQTIDVQFSLEDTGVLTVQDMTHGAYAITTASAIYQHTSTVTKGGKQCKNSFIVSPKNRSCVFIARLENHSDDWSSDAKVFGGGGVTYENQGTIYYKKQTITDGHISGQEWGTSEINDPNPGYIFKSISLIPTDPSGGEAVFDIGNYYGGLANAFTVSSVIFPNISVDQYGNPSGNNGFTLTGVPSYELQSSDTGVVVTARYDGAYILSVTNYDVTTHLPVDTVDKGYAFQTVFVPSPDVYGTYVMMTSGRSAFLGSSYSSAYPGGLSGDGLKVKPAGGEDMSNLSVLVSWVGFG